MWNLCLSPGYLSCCRFLDDNQILTSSGDTTWWRITTLPTLIKMMIVLLQNSVWATHTQPLPCFLQCIVGHRDRPAGHQLHRAHWGRDEFVSKSRLQDLCLRSLWCHLQAVGHPWWHVQAILYRARVWHQCRRCEYRSDTSKKSKGWIKTTPSRGTRFIYIFLSPLNVVVIDVCWVHERKYLLLAKQDWPAFFLPLCLNLW